ncbi:unnamed protein product [Brassicogethes aeneus]|uniref:NADH dehydrogenase [ubiquinone] 1 beta subcomplex subunit 5, mitochondrial n=1 Tax=Brassicogethes aeneus TaxID=1431903 RepID=A0A9P0FGA0_BRAAE|nr:unnamed protein product [Brassicogethes aeneus]
MVVFSTLRPLLGLTSASVRYTVAKRSMSDHKHMNIAPSRWQWSKTKDLLHFYLLLGIIPCSLGVLYANVFIGPAKLSEIPEGYEPKYWEYFKSPVTRFLARYVYTNPQQEYEKYLCYIFVEDEKRKLRELEDQIKKKMSERNDYQAYYYRPVLAKYYRISREAADYLETIRGD